MAAKKKIFNIYDFQTNPIQNVGTPSLDTDVATKGSAQEQANAAQAAAALDATAKADAAQAAAIAAAALDATAKADAAETDAIEAAAADATTKANTAKTEAIAAAALDATAKADAAQAAAIAAAALDATAKADAAEAAAKSYTDTGISNLIASAPETLDTLNELAAALGDDANFSTTVTNLIGTKAAFASGTITGTPTPTADGYEYTVNHALNKANVLVQAYDGNDQVDVFVRKVNDNSVKIITGAALGSTILTIVVVG